MRVVYNSKFISSVNQHAEQCDSELNETALELNFTKDELSRNLYNMLVPLNGNSSQVFNMLFQNLKVK